eukprot:gene68954-94507_t
MEQAFLRGRKDGVGHLVSAWCMPWTACFFQFTLLQRLRQIASGIPLIRIFLQFIPLNEISWPKGISEIPKEEGMETPSAATAASGGV